MVVRTLEEVRAGRVTVTVTVDDAPSSPIGPLYRAAVDAERELVAAQRRVTELEAELAERRYTAEEVGDLQASEAELVAAPLRRRVTELEAELERYRRAHVCTDRCEKNAHVALEGRQLVVELEREKAELETDLAVARQERQGMDERRAAAWRKVNVLEARVAELEEKVRGYDRDRHTERDRADEAQARVRELERRPTFGALSDATNGKDMALGELRTVRAERDRYKEGASLALNERDELRRALNKTREILTDSDVRQAQRMDVSPRGAVMSDAISNALRVLDQA